MKGLKELTFSPSSPDYIEKTEGRICFGQDNEGNEISVESYHKKKTIEERELGPSLD